MEKIKILRNRSARLFIMALAAKGQASLPELAEYIEKMYKVAYNQRSLYNTALKLYKLGLIRKYKRIQEYGVKWDVIAEIEKAVSLNPCNRQHKVLSLSRSAHVQILKIVHENPRITVGGLAQKLNKSIDHISRDTRLLKKAGFIHKDKSGNKVLLKVRPERIPFWDELLKGFTDIKI
jgi:DNA-binding transcriptional ArsR family regulator